MTGIVCSMVGATYAAAVAEVIRKKKSVIAISGAQVDTAQSKFGGASAYFDGNDDYLSISYDSSLRFGTDNFTFECWFRPTAVTQPYPLVMSNINGFATGGWVLHERHSSYSTKLTFWVYSYSTGAPMLTSSTSISNGTWYHVAIVRSGTSWKMYLNGTEEASVTSSVNLDSGNTTSASTVSGSGQGTYNGHVDEIRWSKTARYTSNFTPSTTPFVNDDNTVLLIHADGTDATTYFEDDNGTGRSQAGMYSVNGPTISTTQSKFGGSSLYFPENSGQALYAVHNPQADGLTNNGDFTVELWAYFTKLPSSGDNGYMVFYGYSPEPYMLIQNGGVYLGAGGYPGFTGSTFAINTWYHIAVSRSSGSMKCFVNGTQYGSTVTGSTYNYIPYSNNLFTRFGKFTDDRGRWQGYMDEIRFSKTARYTANFTAPTAPFVNDANTLLLIHGDGTNASTVFRDDNGARAPKGISAIGNAQIDTAQSKFGGASALFDGTGDYLTVGNDVDNDMALTSTTWTVEYWARINSHAGQYQGTIGIWDPNAGTGSVWYVTTNAYNSTSKMGISYFYGTNSSSGDIAFGSALSTGVWQHHAFVRNGNTLTAYLDGISQGTHDMTGRTIDITGYNNSTNTTLKMTIGALTGGSGAFNGHLDEIRISNVARYTAGFTPSTTPFQNDANTVLLIHADGTDGSTVFVDDNGKTLT